MDEARPTLDEVRARIDGIDGELLSLLDERAGLAQAVAEAKRRADPAGGFGLRPEREAQVIRALLARPRRAASPALVLRLWRELMAESLALQGRSSSRSGAVAIPLARRSWRGCALAPRRPCA
jgi:chorismate mutase